MSSQRGFTLIELMTTVGIAAILLAVATPGFVHMNVKNRLVTYSNDFISTVNYARSEAVRRSAPVVICSSSDGASCTGTADSWSSGWIVFVNTDGDSPAEVDAGGTEPILRQHEGLASHYTLGTNAVFATEVVFDADGAANGTGIFAVCHDDELVGAKAISMTRLRPRSAKDTDSTPDRIPNTDGGGNIASCTDP